MTPDTAQALGPLFVAAPYAGAAQGQLSDGTACAWGLLQGGAGYPDPTAVATAFGEGFALVFGGFVIAWGVFTIVQAVRVVLAT